MEFAFIIDITHFGSAFPNAEKSGSNPVWFESSYIDKGD